MIKMIKGYLTNFSKDENFTAQSTGYVNAMLAQADKEGLLNSARVRRDSLHNGADKLTPEDKAKFFIPESVRKMIPADDVESGVRGQEGSGGISPLGVGLGALAGAAALGYGAYRLANRKAELKANGYYAFDNTISKNACRNLTSPGQSRAELRAQYPTARIIKGSTAYQLNPQEFKLAANFSQENFAEPLTAPNLNEPTGLNKIGFFQRPTAVERIKAAREADSTALANERFANDAALSKTAGVDIKLNDALKNSVADPLDNRSDEQKLHEELNERWGSGESKVPHSNTISSYNALIEKEQNGQRLTTPEKQFLNRVARANNAEKTAEIKSAGSGRASLKSRLGLLDQATGNKFNK